MSNQKTDTQDNHLFSMMLKHFNDKRNRNRTIMMLIHLTQNMPGVFKLENVIRETRKIEQNEERRDARQTWYNALYRLCDLGFLSPVNILTVKPSEEEIEDQEDDRKLITIDGPHFGFKRTSYAFQVADILMDYLNIQETSDLYTDKSKNSTDFSEQIESSILKFVSLLRDDTSHLHGIVKGIFEKMPLLGDVAGQVILSHFEEYPFANLRGDIPITDQLVVTHQNQQNLSNIRSNEFLIPVHAQDSFVRLVPLNYFLFPGVNVDRLSEHFPLFVIPKNKSLDVEVMYSYGILSNEDCFNLKTRELLSYSENSMYRFIVGTAGFQHFWKELDPLIIRMNYDTTISTLCWSETINQYKGLRVVPTLVDRERLDFVELHARRYIEHSPCDVGSIEGYDPSVVEEIVNLERVLSMSDLWSRFAKQIEDSNRLINSSTLRKVSFVLPQPKGEYLLEEKSREKSHMKDLSSSSQLAKTIENQDDSLKPETKMKDQDSEDSIDDSDFENLYR